MRADPFNESVGQKPRNALSRLISGFYFLIISDLLGAAFTIGLLLILLHEMSVLPKVCVDFLRDSGTMMS